MANDLVPIGEIERMATAVAKSNLFGMKTPEQAMALMLIANAEGLHPATAAMDYDIIQGRPAKKPQAMLRDYLRNGGKVEWHDHTDAKVSATFAHPAGGSVTVDWDMSRAMKAGLGGKDNWKKYPRQMLRARVISEGIRATFPGATGGLYTPEEAGDFEPATRPMKDVTPKDKAAAVAKVQQAVAPAEIIEPSTIEPPTGDDPFEPPHDPDTGEIADDGSGAVVQAIKDRLDLCVSADGVAALMREDTIIKALPPDGLADVTAYGRAVFKRLKGAPA